MEILENLYHETFLCKFYDKICKLLSIFFFTFFLPSIRMSGKSINFDDKNINKSYFYRNKKLFKIDDIDVDKILVSKKRTYKKFT